MSWLRRVFSTQTSNGRAPRRGAGGLHLEKLDDRDVPAVLYYGGNLLPHVEAQSVFLGSEWSSVPANGSQPKPATLDAALTDLTGGAYMDALTRAGYGVGRGTTSAGVVDNVSLAGGSTVSDASIRARLQADISSGLVQAPDANRLYVVYVQPNVAVDLGSGQGTTRQGVLGYHGAFGGTDPSGNPVTIRYAVVAYPGGTVGNSRLGIAPVDQLTAVTSHEVAEAVTDPDVNFGRLGWYDSRRGEIGDITENNPAAYVRLNGFLVQEVGDRNDRLLTIFPPPPPVPTTPPASTATTTTLTAGSVIHWNPWTSTVTLTVRVTPGSGTVGPGGRVNLLYHGRVIGSGTLRVVNGVEEVSFTVVFNGHGTFAFSAQYAGNSQFQGSSSNTVAVTV